MTTAAGIIRFLYLDNRKLRDCHIAQLRSDSAYHREQREEYHQQLVEALRRVAPSE